MARMTKTAPTDNGTPSLNEMLKDPEVLNPQPKGNKPKASEDGRLLIPKPEVHLLRVRIRGISPLLICRMSAKAVNQIKESGDAKKGKPKSTAARATPDEQFNDARHISSEGWDGIHCGAFRGAMIEAARSIQGVTMAGLKQAIFVHADGYGCETNDPLVRIICEDGPVRFDNICRTATKQPIPRSRPMYREWGALVTFEVNASILDPQSAINLLGFAGRFCGVGEWRPSSKENLTGEMGRFMIVADEE